MQILRVFFMVLLCCASAGAAEGSISVTVTGIKSKNGGELRLSLFKKKEGFPSDYREAFASKSIHITAAEVTAVFEGVPPGLYALAVLHDENSNQRMDTNLFGVPKEGYAVSNNVKKNFGPPAFEEARFTFDGTHKQITLSVIY